MACVESKDSQNILPSDNFISHDIGKLVTVIKDTGRGIEESELQNLLSNKSSSSLQGGNLRKAGLLTAKGLSECLGGKIIIKSKLDQFTQVTFDV